MKIRIGRHIVYALTVIILVACSKIPGNVIQPDDMAALLADIHIAESVIEQNRIKYPTDSTKQLMKQSVLVRHGVTQEQLDSSFNWYGHNISYYMDVYDKTIALLERRISETGNRIAAENISIAGDSVDVWSNATLIAINNLSPSKFLTFSLEKDENWEKGDSYTWRAKFTNNSEPSLWGIAINYDDGSSEFLSSELTGDGWRELRFISDSTKTARKVYGYINAKPKMATTLWADSIMLIRNRLNRDTYGQHYRQNRFSPKNLTVLEKNNDSDD